MKSPFDYVSSINNKLKLPYSEVYSSFLTVRQLSYFLDSILWVNEINRDMDGELQYEFLFHIIPQKKRFSKWAKAEEQEMVRKVQEFFDYSWEKALEAVKILSPEAKEYIQEWHFINFGER